MKRTLILITVLSVALTTLVSSSAARPHAAGAPDVERPSRRAVLNARIANRTPLSAVVVGFKESASRAAVTDAIEDVDGEVDSNLTELGRVKVVDVAPGRVDEAVEALEDDPSVAIVEPDAPRMPALIPNDEFFPEQWALHNRGQEHPIADRHQGLTGHVGKRDVDVDAPRAWEMETGEENRTVIAVLDQGFDLNHPDLAPNLWVNETELNGIDGEDDDDNGKTDDFNGWDFTGSGDPDPQDPAIGDDTGHGTHVAAIAAGAANDGTGVAGMCFDCELLPLRFNLTLSQELEAIDYLIETVKAHPGQIDVLNASFVSFEWSRLERDALARLGRRGVLTVAAAGNGALDNDMLDAIDFNRDGILDDFSPLYPASYDLPTILSVAATNDMDQLGYATGCDARPRVPRSSCMFSNWGRTSVDVGAPGVDIKSAFLSKQGASTYRTMNGTSMAAPLVAGIAGLVASEYPAFGPTDIKNAIMNSVDKPDSLKRVWRLPGGPDKGSFLRTNGRVNARDALEGDTSGATPLDDGSIPGARRIKKARRDSVAWPGDVNDVYRKWLKKGRRYVVKLQADSRRRNLDLVVYKPGTQDVWQLEDGCLGGNGECHVIKPFAGFSRDGTERIEFRAPRGGSYYFLVSSYFDDSAYRVTVRRAR